MLGFFSFLNVYSMQSVLPVVTQDMGITPAQAGMTVGVSLFAVAIVSPFMGMLSDAWGRRPIIVASMFALTLPTALIALAQNLPTVLVLRFLQGLAVPGIVVVLIAYLSEEHRSAGLARMTSLFVGGNVIGGFSGRFFMGHFGDWMGWRSGFWFLALLNLAGALWVWRVFPASRHFVANRNVSGALRMLGIHLRNPRLLAICAVGFCVLFTMLGTFTYINFHLAEEPFHLSSAGLANVFMVYLVGGFITPFIGSVIARHGYLLSMLGGLCLSACGLALTLMPSLTVLIAGLILCSIGVFVCQSATISRIADRVTAGRSLATGLYYMSYYAGGSVGTLITGLAYEIDAWPSAVFAIVLVQCLAGMITWRFLRTN